MHGIKLAAGTDLGVMEHQNIWSENKKYIGEFRNGKKHGFGKFYLDGELVYEGTWKFDKPSIFGRSLEEIFTVKF